MFFIHPILILTSLTVILFLTNNIQEVKQMSERVNQYNIEGKETEKQIFQQAIQEILNL